MTDREERLKSRLLDYIFDTDLSVKSICDKIGLTYTAARLWIFHGYSLKLEQEDIINKLLNQLGY